jgi:hypothetical protein
MKKIVITFFAALALVILPRIGFAITTLSAGDLVIITANSSGTYPSTNGFDFVSRVDIDAGTEIYFTDKGWDGSLGVPFWRSGLSEGVVRFTAPSAISAGTIVHFDDSLIAGAPGTWDMFSIDGATGAFGVASGSNVMDFATSGDNILVFQGTGASPSFIYGVGWAGATTWISSGTPTSNNSWVPVPLTLGTNAISLGSPDNFQYSCGVSGFFSSGFLSSLANSANWVNNTTPYSTSTCTFDVTQPTATINQSVGQNDPTNNSTINFTVVFSEAINPVTFTAGDVVLSGTGTGTVGTPTTSDNITWTVPVTATGSGTIIASLATSTVTDVNGNINLVATSTDNSVTYDTTAPIISEVTAVATPTNDTTPNYTFTTDEAGTITYGGSCSSATTTATVGSNTITLNSLGDGTYTTCTITVTDGAGNVSNILTLSSFTIDTAVPVITVTNPVITPSLSKTVTASSNEGTLTMAINAPGVTTCDGTLTFVAYTSTTFSSEADNTRTICYRAIDAAGNTTYTISSTISGIDTTAPTLILSTAAPAIVTGLFTITITPSESISELTLSDIVVTNGTASNLTGSGPYTVDITPTANGSLTVSVPFGVLPVGVIDIAGNRQTVNSNTLSKTVAFVPSAPTITIVSTSATIGTASGTCEAGATVTLASTNLVPNPTTVVCAISGTYTTLITVSANPATISVTQINAGGTSPAVIGNFNYVTPVSNGNGTTSGGIQYCTETITTFCTPRNSQTVATTTPVSNTALLGKPGQCSVDLLITQNMRVGARNGRINNYSRTTIASKEVMREVKILQKHMNRLGFSSGVEDGILGPITDGAIKRMQKFLGTYQDGLVGPVTRSLINNSCGK